MFQQVILYQGEQVSTLKWPAYMPSHVKCELQSYHMYTTRDHGEKLRATLRVAGTYQSQKFKLKQINKSNELLPSLLTGLKQTS